MRHLSILLSVFTSVLKYTIFLFCCVQAQAQLKVDGFSERILDTSANAPATRVLDNNGETCALIKIFAPRTDGFHCDGGAKGIMKEEVKGGELWIFVPASAQRLIISHTLFGRIEYDYPESLKKGSTYQLLLNVGLGRFITINSTRIGADVEVDGQYIGQTPLYNQYLLYGPHTIKATNGKWEGTMEHLVSANEAATDQQTVVTVPLQDLSQHYGQGHITVDNNADIFYAGRLVGTGSWLFDLREGTYEVETRKADSEPARTTFTVKAGAQGNDLKVKAPTPHTGWLNLYTRPRNVTATDNGSPINLSEVQTLPVGAHQLSISRKGYVTQQREYTIQLNQTTADTIQLERVKYVKPFAFYFGGAYTIRSLSGLSGILGLVLYGHDLQASYTFGLTESDPVYWGGDLNTATKYKMNSIGVKYGYQFNLMRQLAITPQVGYAYNFLTANAAAAGNTIYGDGASSSAASLGAKIVLVPVQHLYFFVAPEYMFALNQDKNFKTITNSSNFSADGFAVNVGVLVNF
ncbi:MAG: PEGA domain-containing protein [Bacteroidaceae bacterium]|nr:PEGA domain-containing protein [Bacteroidaceae bacterium]